MTTVQKEAVATKKSDELFSSSSESEKPTFSNLPPEIHQYIADKLRFNKDVVNLRNTSKNLNKIRKRKNLISKYDMRNYTGDITELSDIDEFYKTNEAKCLFIAELVDKDYIKNGYHIGNDIIDEYMDEAQHQAILQSGATAGDIVFYGDNDQMRQVDGFALKDKNRADLIYIDNLKYGGPEHLIKIARKLFPDKNYDNSSKILLEFWKQYIDMETENLLDYSSEEEEF